MAKTDFKTVNEYISTFPDDVRDTLIKIRKTIRDALPDEAEEVISYQMPAFRLYGNLVYFAAHTIHIGFYPTPSAIKAFRKELTPYEISKGSVKFPLDQPIPFDLISKIAKY